jgi:hypothetical protein
MLGTSLRRIIPLRVGHDFEVKMRGLSGIFGAIEWKSPKSDLMVNEVDTESGLLQIKDQIQSTKRYYRKAYKLWPNDWLPFKWERPVEKMVFLETGDPEEPVTCDPKLPRPGFEFLKERKEVPDEVKKLFEMGMFERGHIRRLLKNEKMNSMQRHPFDIMSNEALIAKYTAQVRSYQDQLRNINPHDIRAKKRALHCHRKRKSLLNELYRQNRERYEVVTRVLNIDHKPSTPGAFEDVPIQRKKELRRLTNEYCDNIRKERLEEYHETLKQQHQDFLEEKAKNEKWIQEQMTALNITEEDLEAVKK